MLYTYKAKTHVNEIKNQLVSQLQTLFKDIEITKPGKGKAPVHFFKGIDLRTGKEYKFRISFVKTDRWNQVFHVFRVEFESSFRAGDWVEF